MQALLTRHGITFHLRKDGLYWLPGTGERAPCSGWTKGQIESATGGAVEVIDVENPPDDAAFGDLAAIQWK